MKLPVIFYFCQITASLIPPLNPELYYSNARCTQTCVCLLVSPSPICLVLNFSCYHVLVLSCWPLSAPLTISESAFLSPPLSSLISMLLSPILGLWQELPWKTRAYLFFSEHTLKSLSIFFQTLFRISSLRFSPLNPLWFSVSHLLLIYLPVALQTISLFTWLFIANTQKKIKQKCCMTTETVQLWTTCQFIARSVPSCDSFLPNLICFFPVKQFLKCLHLSIRT